jgi:ABC-2 type transport system ATP-binding protein
MADVQALCKRVIVIHHGRLLFDGALSALSGRFAAYKTIGLTASDGDMRLDGLGEVVSRDGDRVTLRVPRDQTSAVAARLLADGRVSDLTIEDPPIEDVIALVFAQQVPE